MKTLIKTITEALTIIKELQEICKKQRLEIAELKENLVYSSRTKKNLKVHNQKDISNFFKSL